MSKSDSSLKRIFPSKPELLPWETLKLLEFSSRTRSTSSFKITKDSQLLSSKKMKNLSLIETLNFNLNPIKLEILRLSQELCFSLLNSRQSVSRTEIELLRHYCLRQKDLHGILKDSNMIIKLPISSLNSPDSMDCSKTTIESRSYPRIIRTESLT